MTMSLLVTGSTGFIGRHLIEYFVKKSYKIFVLARKPSQTRKIFPESVTVLAHDQLCDYQYDALINLAGAGIVDWPWTPGRIDELYRSRIDYSQKLFETLAKGNSLPPLLINASAIGYYGFQGETLLTESSPFSESLVHDLCARWEQVARNSAIEQVSCLRFSMVLGKNGGALSRLLPAFKLGLGGRIGDGAQWLSWVHIQDVIAIIEGRLLGRHCHEVINICAPHPLTQGQFAKTLAQLLNRPCFVTTPKWLLRLALGQGSQLLTESCRAVSSNLQEDGYKFCFETCEGALGNILFAR